MSRNTKKITQQELRKLILNETRSAPHRKPKHASLVDLLFEQEAPESEDEKPATIVVLYGPPAAGKGAAKGAVGDFVGNEGGENYEDWLEAQGEAAGKYFQEEDEMMVNAMTDTLPPLIFKEIYGRVEGGEDFDSVISDYWHVNESDKDFQLSSLLSKGAFEKVVKENTDDEGNVDVEAAAQQFADFPNTSAYFTQARGFSKEIEGADDVNQYMGVKGGTGNQTLGMRAAAASQYLTDVKKELASLGADQVGDTTYAGVYLMDQAGESSADTGRISNLISLKDESAPGVITLIGVYIAQPQERTELANLHRAATGGRRVSSKEVDRIFDAGPQFLEDGSLDTGNLGPAIDAMMTGFDQVHVYQPEKPFVTDDPDGFAAKICAPLGIGKGSLDIEGCPDEAGPETRAKSYMGMEKLAMKDAGLGDHEGSEGGAIPSPDKLADKEKEAISDALTQMGFAAVTSSDLDSYLTDMGVPGVRGSGKYGDLPSKDLFGKGTSPTKRTTLKGESTRFQKNTDDLIVERWRKLAGLL